MTGPRPRPSKISALISDVDGTLVTSDKVLTGPVIDAARRLQAAGIAFSVVSSRPPRGLRMLVEPLGLVHPIAGFNGGLFNLPRSSSVKQFPLPPDVARHAVDKLQAIGVDVWLFTAEDWLMCNPENTYNAREGRTVAFQPRLVADFESGLDNAFKIVGVSHDFELLARCDAALNQDLAGKATVARSQNYYLDITHLSANKGHALLEFAKLLDVPAAEIAVIGDGRNDMAMFEKAGFAIAMGNGAPEVQNAADCVTDSNAEDGFAKAVDRFILNRASSS